MDGVRARWDGSRLLSRRGNVISAPRSFTEGLPSVELDGELWMGRGTLERLMAVYHSPTHEDWGKVRYVVFDMPAGKEPFESRLDQLRRLLLPPHAQVAVMSKCEGERHLAAYLAEVCSAGGEGVMAQDPHGPYRAGRVPSLLKVKQFEDSEVRLVEVVAGGLRCEQ